MAKNDSQPPTKFCLYAKCGRIIKELYMKMLVENFTKKLKKCLKNLLTLAFFRDIIEVASE